MKPTDNEKEKERLLKKKEQLHLKLYKKTDPINDEIEKIEDQIHKLYAERNRLEDKHWNASYSFYKQIEIIDNLLQKLNR